MKKVGILGGMGPEATILLQNRLLRAVEAHDDGGHIPLLIEMNPQVPSRLSWILEKKGDDPGPVLASMASALQSIGAEMIVMPCNTAHAFAPQIVQAIDIPFLHMPELAAAQVAERVGSRAKVGILASPATQVTGLFEQIFAPHQCEVIFPQDPDNLLRIIKSLKAEGPSNASIEALQAEAMALEAAGVDCLLIGCSEFSLLSGSMESNVFLTDTLDVLVDHIVTATGANRRQAITPPQPALPVSPN